MSRAVTLVLVGSDGAIHGALSPFVVATPWWQDALDVVAGARVAHGVEVTILRILHTSLPRPHGGEVTYLAEIDGEAPAGLIPVADGLLVEDPLRQTWARPGGPSSDLTWADEQLRRAGTPRIGRPTQVRTWNLSSLWRIPTARGAVWLKVVPPFFAHEGAILARVAIGPPLVAHDGARSLMRDLPGDDLYGPDARQFVAMVRALVGEQARWFDRTDELLAIGVPDSRAGPLTEWAGNAVERAAHDVDASVAARARELVDGFGDRFRAIASCGLPDTLVHGDFHGGNARSDGAQTAILDWGDCCIGHPLLDEAAAVEHVGSTQRSAARQAFVRAWQDAVPGSDPARAAALLRPVAALRQAATYRHFLDRIEPSERPFHRDDPAYWIARAVR